MSETSNGAMSPIEAARQRLMGAGGSLAPRQQLAGVGGGLVAAMGRRADMPPPIDEPPPIPESEAPPPIEGGDDGARRVKHTKKLDLAKLPKQWRNSIFQATGPERRGRLASAVAVLWATGCRPAELEKGVRVSLNEAGRLVVEIRGAKVGTIDNGETVADRGMEWRRLVINPQLNNATQYLADLAAAGPQVVEYNKNSLRTRLNEIGRLHLKKVPEGVTVSPYTFRHAMGSDLKSCDDMTDEEKAQVMGHLAMDSLSVYGRRRHRGGVSPVQAVEASDVPRGEYTDAPQQSKRRPAARR